MGWQTKIFIATSLLVLTVITWQVWSIHSLMTLDGDRSAAKPSSEHLMQERLLQDKLEEDGQVDFGPELYVEYCFIGIGGNPNPTIDEMRTRFEGYHVDTVVGPLFFGSDVNWHIRSNDHAKRRIKIFSFDSQIFGTFQRDGDSATVCGPGLRVTYDRKLRQIDVRMQR